MNPDKLRSFRKTRNPRGGSGGVGGDFHKIGIHKLADLEKEFSSEDEAIPLPSKSGTGSSFLENILADAKKGGTDFVSPEEKKKQERKKREHLRRKEELDRAYAPRSVQGGLPSMRDLQHLNNALRNGTAFYDSYRPDRGHNAPRAQAPYRPESPLMNSRSTPITNAYQLSTYPKVPNYHGNSCQVGFCEHVDACINWDPSDPENREGSWRAWPKYYWKSETAEKDHESCQKSFDVFSKGKVLAKRIVQKFVDIENGKLTSTDRWRGKVPARPPPLNRVEREVHTMISHMFRATKIDEKVDAMEAVTANKDAAARLEELKKETRERAQKDRQYIEVVKSLSTSNLKAKEVPTVKPQQPKKRKDLSESEDVAAQSLIEPQTSRKRQKVAPGASRLNSITTQESTACQARLTKQVKQDCPTLAAKATEKQPKTAAAKPTKAPPKSKAIISDSDSDGSVPKKVPTMTAPTKKVPTKTATRSRTVVRPDPSEDSEEIEMVPLEESLAAYKAQEVQKAPEVATKPKPHGSTDEERALLASLKQAVAVEEEKKARAEASIAEQHTGVEDRYTPMSSASPAKDVKTPTKQPQVDETKSFDLHGDFPTKSPTSKAASNKRKPSITELDIEVSQPAEKKPRKNHKSAATIEDSDEEAAYELPTVPSIPNEPVARHDWSSEGTALVAEILQHQEEVAAQREEKLEKGALVIVAEEEVVAQMSDHGENQHGGGLPDEIRTPTRDADAASSTPTTPPAVSSPLSPKRKRDSSFDEASAVDTPASSSPPRPLKKTKTKTVRFAPDVVFPVARPRTKSVPWIVDVDGGVHGEVDTAGGREKEQSAGDEGKQSVGDKIDGGRESDVGLDELFEE